MELSFVLILRFFLLFSFILISTSEATPNNLISEICEKTRNPSLCSHILKSNSKALKAYYPKELGDIAINLSITSALETRKAIVAKGILRTGDKALKDRFKQCQANYINAMYYLRSSSYLLKHRDLLKFAKYAAAALNEANHCREIFAKQPPTEPVWLKDGNEKMECLCSAVLVISDRLSGKKLSVLESGNIY